ncbi:helix-turn-helix domain-containing protein [uncultured Thiocystis sp.]|jgi:excisionase family DNA binding protein|uniref:helix-turn-helix domain-containing protein n=1 Tax=uncultured Thiocystis sp. TaxID=1202134 RepID=UPI0025F5F7FC|nr:helix-turn-helix domain-containing protein [uncultured Thiocystis sp.]
MNETHDPTASAILPHNPIPTRPRRAYPVEEACYLLGGISRKSIYDLIKTGELGSVTLCGRRLVPADAIDTFLAAKSSPATAQPFQRLKSPMVGMEAA